MDQYEKIDREVIGICKKAEAKCKPSWAGTYEWSPALATAIKTLSYWRHRLKTNTESVVVRKMGKQLQIPYVALSQCTIHQMINKSKNKLREVQENAREYRKSHLEALAVQYANQNNMAPQRAITELIAHEESRGMFCTLRQHLRPTVYSSLSTLWKAQDEEGNYIKDNETKAIYTDQSEIYRLLLERNAKHLSQASSTPFAKGVLRKDL